MTDYLSPWAKRMRIKEGASKQQSRLLIEKRDEIEKERRRERTARLKEALNEHDRSMCVFDDTTTPAGLDTQGVIVRVYNSNSTSNQTGGF